MLEKPQLEIKITKGSDGSGNLKALSMYPPSIFEAPLPVSPLLAASNASVLRRTQQNQWLLLNHVIYFIRRDFQLLSSFAPPRWLPAYKGKSYYPLSYQNQERG